jgi:kanamycin kinase
VVAGPPRSAVDIPDVVRRIAANHGGAARLVWENELGGLTFEVNAESSRRLFVKWARASHRVDLREEAKRLAWAAPRTPVPRVLESGADDAESWLVSTPIPGENAVSERWKRDPTRAVAAIGRGLRAFHDRLPVDVCPFSWSVSDRRRAVLARAAAGELDPAKWHPDHGGLTVEQACALLADPPPVERLVVCHGDTCAPNTMIADDGEWSGHVDLGAMGVADRWADIAIATWSTQWNYGAGWEEPLLDAYGVAPDPVRTRYYRLLWDLGS